MPIKTILPPFEVFRYPDYANEEDTRRPQSLEYDESRHEFHITKALINELVQCDKMDDAPVLSLQVRCICLSPAHPFTHAFPTFGHLKINGLNYQ